MVASNLHSSAVTVTDNYSGNQCIWATSFHSIHLFDSLEGDAENELTSLCVLVVQQVVPVKHATSACFQLTARNVDLLR